MNVNDVDDTHRRIHNAFIEKDREIESIKKALGEERYRVKQWQNKYGLLENELNNVTRRWANIAKEFNKMKDGDK